jgi:hypothetical protein
MTLDPTKSRKPSPDNDSSLVEWQTGDEREDKSEGSESGNDRATGSEPDVETDQPTRSESPI